MQFVHSLFQKKVYLIGINQGLKFGNWKSGYLKLRLVWILNGREHKIQRYFTQKIDTEDNSVR